MKSKMNANDQRVYDFICQYYDEHGFSPSYREIMEGAKVRSQSTVSYILDKLNNLGKIVHNESMARSIVIPPKSERVPGQGSYGEEAAALYFKSNPNLPQPEREFKFRSDREWRFDFAWPEQQLAIEIEGGTWQMGRHQRPEGFTDDCYKYNWAALHGWTVLRYTTAMIESLDALRDAEIFFGVQMQENIIQKYLLHKDLGG